MTQEEIFEKASKMLDEADSVRDCLRAEELFKSILGHPGAGAMVAACRMKADEIKKKD